MTRPRDVFVSAIDYVVGEPRALEDLADGTEARSEALRALTTFGLRSYRVAAEGPLELARRSLRKTLERCGEAPGEIGAVIYCSETLGGADATARAIGSMLESLGLRHAWLVTMFGAVCANVAHALGVAVEMVESGERDNVLVVLTDVERSEQTRVFDPPVTVCSDGAASCLVSAQPRSGFRVRGVSMRTYERAAGEAPSGAFPMLQEAQRAIRAQLEEHLGALGTTPASYVKLLMNNYLSSATRFFAMAAGFRVSSLYSTQVAELAHVGASDGLINAKHCLEDGSVRPGESVLILCNGLSVNLDSWGAISLEAVA